MAIDDAGVAPPAWIETFDMWTDDEFHEDPFPKLTELRTSCPVAHSSSHGGYWFLTDYDSVYRVLRDDVSFSHIQSTVPPTTKDIQIPISLDPPAHSPWRNLLTPSFSPGRVKEFEPLVRETAARLARSIKERGSCEFMNDFAVEIPIAAILPFMGMPSSALPLVRAWEEESMRRGNISAQARAMAQTVTKPKVRAYLSELIEQRRESGPTGSDLISALVSGKVDGREPTVPEMVNACAMVLSAGLHTTAGTLSNMIHYLVTHPDKRDQIVADPSLIPVAIEELMRYEGLVTTGKLAIKEVVIAGQTIRSGDPVLLSIPSALRDERIYDHADEVDFDRPPKGTLAFGAGIHRCLGSHLARMELRVSLEEIHRIMPDYRLMPDKVVLRHTAVHRVTEELWLEA